jgi:hypothetical protein
MKDPTNIRHFLSHMTNKDYSQANKALQRILEDKLKQRVKNCLDAKPVQTKK